MHHRPDHTLLDEGCLALEPLVRCGWLAGTDRRGPEVLGVAESDARVNVSFVTETRSRPSGAASFYLSVGGGGRNRTANALFTR